LEGRLQALDEQAGSAKQQIDVQLQRRADLVPNLVATAKGYAQHEEEVFTKVAEARAGLLGAIKTGGAPPRGYDVVVTVTGPRQTVMARRKERVAGIWINKGSRTFADIPSFLGVFANRPFDAIASAGTLRQQGIGFKNAVFVEQNVGESDPYLTNLVDIWIDEKLYKEQAQAVTFLSSTVFRVDIPLPQSALIGDYNVDLKLFSSGVAVAQTSSTFNVMKVGVEAFVVKASLD